jgi:hypothetical protein
MQVHRHQTGDVIPDPSRCIIGFVPDAEHANQRGTRVRGAKQKVIWLFGSLRSDSFDTPDSFEAKRRKASVVSVIEPLISRDTDL